MKKPSLPKFLKTKNVTDNGFALELSTTEDNRMYTCPYSDCGREFVNPILVTNNSMTPPETYLACPYCLSRIDVNEKPKIEEKIEEETPQINKLKEIKETIEKNLGKKKPAGEGKCPYHFGYLKEKAKSAPIPEECLTCPKMIECLL